MDSREGGSRRRNAAWPLLVVLALLGLATLVAQPRLGLRGFADVLVLAVTLLVVVMLLVLLVPRGPASPKAEGSTAGVLTERRGKTGAVAKGDEDHVDLEGLDLPLV